jgi:hypothetical protein
MGRFAPFSVYSLEQAATCRGPCDEVDTMLRTAILGATLTLLGAAAPAAAQPWGFGVGVGHGPPVFWGPPPVYYDRPVIRRRAPPAYYYEEPPMFVPAEPPPVYRMVGPDEVFDMLDAAGYRELSPMARRGAVYKLNAVSPDGDLVALDISIFSGAIERARVIEARYAAPPPAAPPLAVVPPPARPKPARQAAAAPEPVPPPAAAPNPAPAPSGAAPAPMKDRLQPVPAEPAGDEPDPLVVY